MYLNECIVMKFVYFFMDVNKCNEMNEKKMKKKIDLISYYKSARNICIWGLWGECVIPKVNIYQYFKSCFKLLRLQIYVTFVTTAKLYDDFNFLGITIFNLHSHIIYLQSLEN